MKQEILDFIKSQRVGVLAVEMLDGSPHAATLHVAHSENPLQFFFKTHKNYRKCEPLLEKGSTRASVVIGFDESNMKTLQMDGDVSVLSEKSFNLFKETFLAKFPEKQIKDDDSDSILLSFVPTWWRYTDWTKPEGKVIITSTDK